MAVTKIIAIRDRMDKRVNYVVNSEKTSLDAGVAYITNPEKTEQTFFTKTINCHTIGTAYAEMMDTKRYWNKMGGVLGFHIIQSFAPGEVTPKRSHEIGIEFCKRLPEDVQIDIAIALLRTLKKTLRFRKRLTRIYWRRKVEAKNAGLIVVKILLIPYQLNFKIVKSDGLLAHRFLHTVRQIDSTLCIDCSRIKGGTP